ncbi:Vegetative incompatibility protein HET-E-1 [Cyphellophora attinorum]|uniref:Vegetative incompatibility protein HET-E-1 n=1 Tax=Cyphellophora attinorum TaxID=1664694 RepID=A0A0N1HI84_9EURO|nr:Vegetative incompatibility protein HET-E-1 [Phialophora attinorum]KPI45966.1 Vegetative incompatibility protein HET-E-1 [Phialophora attinorum]
MRLLHTTNFEFRESYDEEWLFGRSDTRWWLRISLDRDSWEDEGWNWTEPAASYAILSHTWGEKEVSFKDFNKKRRLYTSGIEFQHAFQNEKTKEPGFWKIVQACLLAWKQDQQWIWIDTCCIDKRSSSELSEAINSMMAWYSKATVCYAYLADVIYHDKMHESRWHTRGWCLQELLAPRMMYFFDHDWNEIGERGDLRTAIVDATGIDEKFLPAPGQDRSFPWRRACIANKMSWMARRRTTRVEDMAYCILGIFGINMPLLYGEGQKAFHRLQLEILRQSDDESLFAWNPYTDYSYYGLLAPHVHLFRLGGSIQSGRQFGPFAVNRRPYQMTNRGLEFTFLRGMPVGGSDSSATEGELSVEVGLDCYRLKSPENRDVQSVDHRNCADQSNFDRVFITIDKSPGYPWHRNHDHIHTHGVDYPLGWVKGEPYPEEQGRGQQTTVYIRGEYE